MLSRCPVCGKDALHELDPSKMGLGIETFLDLGVGGRWCICVKVSNLGKATEKFADRRGEAWICVINF